MADAIRSKQSAFVEAGQSISNLPLDAGETEAIGGIEIFVNYHGPDDVGGADRLTCAAKRVEHAARRLTLFEHRLSDGT